VKLLSHSVPPFAFAASRGLLAMVALLLWLGLYRGFFARSRDGIPGDTPWRTVRHMLVHGTTNGWLPNVLTITAVRYVDSAMMAMIQASVPLIVVVLAHLLFADERFRVGQFIGVLVGFVGIVLIVGPLAVYGGRGSLIGVVAMLMVAVCFAGGTVYGRFAAASGDPVTLACGQQAFGAAIAAGVSLVWEPQSAWQQPLQVWELLAVVGVLCSALPTALYLRLLGRGPSVPAALVAYLQPIWATVLGRAVLGERVGAAALLGTAFVIAGIVVSTRRT
jgi:drug/metabolite transporter (DMT)-like permease